MARMVEKINYCIRALLFLYIHRQKSMIISKCRQLVVDRVDTGYLNSIFVLALKVL